MGHAGLGQAGGQGIEGIVEGGEDDGLLAAFEALMDELQRGMELGNVTGAGAGSPFVPSP